MGPGPLPSRHIDLADVTAVVKVRDHWVLASSHNPPDNPPMDFALVTSGSVQRSGHFDSLGEALGFAEHDVRWQGHVLDLFDALWDRNLLPDDLKAKYVGLPTAITRHRDKLEALLPPSV